MLGSGGAGRSGGAWGGQEGSWGAGGRSKGQFGGPRVLQRGVPGTMGGTGGLRRVWGGCGGGSQGLWGGSQPPHFVTHRQRSQAVGCASSSPTVSVFTDVVSLPGRLAGVGVKGQRRAVTGGGTPQYPGGKWGGGQHPKIVGTPGGVVTMGVGGVTGVSQPLQPRFALPHEVLGGQTCGFWRGGGSEEVLGCCGYFFGGVVGWRGGSSNAYGASRVRLRPRRPPARPG